MKTRKQVQQDQTQAFPAAAAKLVLMPKTAFQASAAAPERSSNISVIVSRIKISESRISLTRLSPSGQGSSTGFGGKSYNIGRSVARGLKTLRDETGDDANVESRAVVEIFLVLGNKGGLLSSIKAIFEKDRRIRARSKSDRGNDGSRGDCGCSSSNGDCGRSSSGTRTSSSHSHGFWRVSLEVSPLIPLVFLKLPDVRADAELEAATETDTGAAVPTMDPTAVANEVLTPNAATTFQGLTVSSLFTHAHKEKVEEHTVERISELAIVLASPH